MWECFYMNTGYVAFWKKVSVKKTMNIFRIQTHILSVYKEHNVKFTTRYVEKDSLASKQIVYRSEGLPRQKAVRLRGS